MTEKDARIANRLLEVSADDRAWIMAQLAPEQRIRIVALLRDSVGLSGARTEEESPVERSVSRESVGTLVEELSVLGQADAETISALLAREASWIRAILVREARWPWVEEYLATLASAELTRIERWVKSGRGRIKPAIDQLLCELAEQKVETTRCRSHEKEAFEVVLAKVKSRNYGDNEELIRERV